jgi:hypothetical protein
MKLLLKMSSQSSASPQPHPRVGAGFVTLMNNLDRQHLPEADNSSSNARDPLMEIGAA